MEIPPAQSAQDYARLIRRGHCLSAVVHDEVIGFAAAAPSLLEVVRLSIYLPKNARVQMKAAQLGGFKPLSQGEIANRLRQLRPNAPESYRAWEYWAHRAGCQEML